MLQIDVSIKSLAAQEAEICQSNYLELTDVKYPVSLLPPLLPFRYIIPVIDAIVGAAAFCAAAIIQNHKGALWSTLYPVGG